MKLLNILPLVSLAYAFDMIRPGSMYISKVGDIPCHHDLYMYRNKLVMGTQFSNFAYDPNGSIKMVGEEGKYLAIDGSGKFFLDTKPHHGFLLETSSGRVVNYKRSLSYNGELTFELCADNLIGFKSNCEGARAVKITYEDIIQPR